MTRVRRSWLVGSLAIAFVAPGWAVAQEAPPKPQQDLGGAGRAQEAVDRLLRAYQHVLARDYDAALERFDLIRYAARVNKAPAWVGATGAFYAAVVRLHRGKQEAGLKDLEEAVRLGFADPVELHEMLPLAARKLARVKQAYARMHCTSADLRELAWLKAERSATEHDTSMMVTANLGRKDRGYTRIVQTRVPLRATRSASVVVFREMLRRAQAAQRSVVLRSDVSRLQHLTSMSVIGNMGGTKPNPSLRLQQQLLSRRIAEQAYQRRVESVKQRQFKPAAGDSDARVAPPPLGSLAKPSAKLPDPPAPPSAAEVAADPNPFQPKGIRVGGAAQYLQTTRAQGNEQRTLITVRVTAVFGGRCATEVETKDAAGKVSREYVVSTFEPTLRRQIEQDLAQLGDVKVLGYTSKQGTYTHRGKELPARTVKVQAERTAEGQAPQRWEITYVVHPEVPATRVLAITLAAPGFVLQRTLVGVEAGPAPAKPQKNPLAAARVGDWSTWEHTELAGKKVVSQTTTTETVTDVSGGRLACRIVTDGKVTGDYATVVQKTLLEQLMFDLDQQGAVELLRHQTQDVSYTYKGASLPAQKLELTIRRTANGKPEQHRLTLWRTSKLPGLGLLEARFTSGSGAATRRVLKDSGRAKD